MNKKLTWIGIGITVSYLIATAFLGWGQWEKFSEMKPNEVGDFLAGVVGPLALLWLILGYFQQGEELKQSTEALRLQAEELRNSVEQQQALVEVTKMQVDAQLEAFKHEREEQRRSVSPLLIFKYASGYGIGRLQRYKFNLQNYGATITRCEITLQGRPRLPTASTEVFARGVGLDIEFTHDVDNLDSVNVLITFLDGAGRPGMWTFRIDFTSSSTPGINDVSVVRIED